MSAPSACETERISIQRPKSMIVTSDESSHHSGIASKPSVTATLNTKATVIAREMSVIIPGVLSAISPHAPFTKIHPPETYTAIPKTTGIQRAPGTAGGVNPSTRGIISPQMSVGTVSSSVTQNLFLNIATE